MNNPKRKIYNNPITTVFKIKCLRRNLTNMVKDFYTENYKTLLNGKPKQIGKTSHVHGLKTSCC